MAGKDSNVTMRLVVARKDGSQGSSGSYGLPEDLLQYSLKRVQLITLIVGFSMILSIFTHGLVTHAIVKIPFPVSTLWLRIAALVASFTLFVIIRYTRLSSQLKCDLGLMYGVLVAANIFALEATLLPVFDLRLGTVSFASVWIVTFHLIVPSSSIRTLISAMASAATIPLVIWLIRHTGHSEIPNLVAGSLLKTTFGTAIIAWLASRSVYHFGKEVSSARVLGSYKLDKQLGQGGMGEVWLASHAQLNRPAAIKLIQTSKLQVGGAGNSNMQRFEREAQATAHLKSTHTVNLYDFGSTSEGTFYYAMEYLEGIDLDTLVERFGPVRPERAVWILKQVCHSLMDAHSNQMIHRDIKPSNIRICQMGPDYDFVKVLDFGLVKYMDTVKMQDKQDANLTTDGMALGTPAFMAPEVALGSANIGPAADIYSFGCVAYWLLTGKQVFEGDNPVKVLSQHIQSDPIPVSQRTEIEIPEALAQLIMDCLEKEESKRPKSAKKLYQRLNQLDFGNFWDHDRARQWWETHQPLN